MPICRSWSTEPCSIRLSASLARSESGHPIEGRRLRFLAGDQVVCSALTDPEGHAACTGVVSDGDALRSGWRVLFAGDGELHGASAIGDDGERVPLPSPMDSRFDGPAWRPKGSAAPKRGFSVRRR